MNDLSTDLRNFGFPQDGAEDQILLELSNLARGFDVYGQRIQYDKQLQAMELYDRLKRRREEQQLNTARFRLDVMKQEDFRAIEDRRIDVSEYQAVTARAEVVVKAIAVAAQAGADSQQLLDAIENLSGKLLPDRESLGSKLLLEAKSKKS